ncbi:Flp pilus assembly protein CpaB [Aliidiomarina sp. Khilg15.8]
MKISLPWRSLVPLVCGLCAAIAALWLVQAHVERELQRQASPSMSIASVEVLVPAMDLAPGTLLKPAHLQVRQLPRPGLPADVISVNNASTVFEQVLAVAVQRGRPLQYLHLQPAQPTRFSEMLEPGQRAFAMPLASGSSSGRLLVVGDWVDLYEQRQQQFIPLLQAQVIATGDSWQADEYTDRTASVTLAVTVSQVARLEQLNRQNALAFWLRHPADTSSLPAAPLQSAELIVAGQLAAEVW